MNRGTAIAFLLLVVCAAHARRLEPTRRPRTTAATVAATPQPSGSNGGGDVAAGSNSPQTPPLAIAGRRRPCGPGTGRRCIPLPGGGRREGGGSVRDIDGRTFKQLPPRPLLIRRRTTTSPPPTTTPSRVASGGEVLGPRGKWLGAGGGCLAELSCPVGKCCVNVIVGGHAKSMCQDLARHGEYCSAEGLQPPYAKFCPCEGGSQCKPLNQTSPRGGHGHTVGVCQLA